MNSEGAVTEQYWMFKITVSYVTDTTQMQTIYDKLQNLAASYSRKLLAVPPPPWLSVGEHMPS